MPGFSHEIISPRDPASGLPTGKRQHKPVLVTKPIDSGSPLLMEQFLQGVILYSVRVESFRQSGRTSPMKLYYTLELLMHVSSYSLSQEETPTRRNQAHEVREHVSFTYQKITWTWADGSEQSDVWELEPYK